MRLLIFQAKHFSFTATHKGSPLGAEIPVPASDAVDQALVAYIQMEPRDEERDKAVLDQAVKYFRWFARKREMKRVVLHSFAHLAEERSSPEFALEFFQRLQEKLEQYEFVVSQTPFGWSLEWDLQVEGHAFAKTFKAL